MRAVRCCFAENINFPHLKYQLKRTLFWRYVCEDISSSSLLDTSICGLENNFVPLSWLWTTARTRMLTKTCTGNILVVFKVMHFPLKISFKGLGNAFTHSYYTTTDCWAPYLQQHTKGTWVNRLKNFLSSRIVRCDEVLVRLSV